MSANRTVIHIGPGKTGTTYIQRALAASRDELRTSGWLYPGPHYNQGSEFMSLLKDESPWSRQWERDGKATLWDPMMAEIHSWNGSVVLSHEILAGLRQPAIELLLGSLGRRDVEVVITARDWQRILPSAVQQQYKDGATYTATEFYERLREERTKDIETIDSWWPRAFMLPQLVDRWLSMPQVKSVRVAVNPARGSVETLWSRVVHATELPLDPDNAPEVPKDVANIALNVEQIRLLRYLSIELERSDLSETEQRDLRWRVVTHSLSRREMPPNPLLVHQRAWREVIDGWAAEDVAGLHQRDIPIFGDLSQLRPPVGDAPDAPDPTVLPEVEVGVMDAAVTAIVAAYGHLPPPAPPMTFSRVVRGVKNRIRPPAPAPRQR